MCGILGWIGAAGPMDKERLARRWTCSPIAGLTIAASSSPAFAGASPPVDRRPVATGHQPMVESGSGAAIVFNGEIYNHLELRAELEIWDTASSELRIPRSCCMRFCTGAMKRSPG